MFGVSVSGPATRHDGWIIFLVQENYPTRQLVAWLEALIMKLIKQGENSKRNAKHKCVDNGHMD